MSGVTVKFHIKEAQTAIEGSAQKMMHKAVNEVRNTTLETLSGKRTGRTYFVPGTKRTYTASAPGEPPAQATGRLRQSVKGVVKGMAGTVTGQVGSVMEYAPCLEYGTKKMAARPWLRPSFEKARVDSILGSRWF